MATARQLTADHEWRSDRVYQRDASVNRTSRPSRRLLSWHWVSTEGQPSCGVNIVLLPDTERDPSDVPYHVRCHRRGCRQRWHELELAT